MTNLNQINLRADQTLINRIDQARGDIPRNKWITRALETALNLQVTPDGRVKVDHPDAGLVQRGPVQGEQAHAAITPIL